MKRALKSLNRIAYVTATHVARISAPETCTRSFCSQATYRLVKDTTKEQIELSPEQLRKTSNSSKKRMEELEQKPSPEKKERGETQNKTQAELDEEMRHKMAALAGDGGVAGVEFEDGKPVAMKRGVRDNMFRLI